MAGPLDFLPVYSEPLENVRERMDGDANGGIDPSDPAYTDTREGTFYWDMTQVGGLEAARLWDALGSETVAAAFPSTAWGEYLDEHGLTFNLTRNPAVAATGTVLFAASTPTLVPTGTQVTASPTDPSLDAITFATTTDGTTAAMLNAPSNVTVTPQGGGQLVAGTYYYHVTSYNAFGESTGSPDVAGVIPTTPGKNLVGWNAVTGAAGYRVYRTLTPDTLGDQIADVATLSFTDDGTITPTVQEPTINTTGGVLIDVLAQVPGSDGNLPSGALSTLATFVPGITYVTNALPTGGGTDVEDDEAFRLRILSQFQGRGAGTQNDYIQISLAYPGVERCAVIPIWNGPGTVLVIPMLSNGSAVALNVVTGLQTRLDPTPGLGAGEAPIGATVTVATTTDLPIAIGAQVVPQPGYTLDGTGGTFDLRTPIVAALTAYLKAVNPGGTIVYQQILATFFVPGVQGINSLLVSAQVSALSSGLSTGGAIISLPVAAIDAALTAGMVVVTTSGLHTQSWTLSGNVAAGATSLPVNSQTPNFAYPNGSVVSYSGIEDIPLGVNPPQNPTLPAPTLS